jgi:DNA-directed RNA polymerase subunit RPC12/RpoP
MAVKVKVTKKIQCVDCGEGRDIRLVKTWSRVIKRPKFFKVYLCSRCRRLYRETDWAIKILR